ncbi:MAG TPA: hypothetical protein VFG59_05550, partial [Anaeromyxobacter sp.]|nr:hypothetical protein [Anaeromyxobacter sp.]
PTPPPAAAAAPAPAPAPAAPAPAPPSKPAPRSGERTTARGSARERAAGPAAPQPSAAPAPPLAAAPPSRPEGPGLPDYFPLAVGNEWVYVDQSPALPAERRGVHRTVRILSRTDDGFFRDNERGELRLDGDCVRDRRRRLLCQPFTVGATWSSVVSVSSTEHYEIAANDESVETPAGRFERCVRVRAHNRAGPGTDQVLEITYAPRVGPVRIETYVVVDGRVTPQVRALLQSYRVEGK